MLRYLLVFALCAIGGGLLGRTAGGRVTAGKPPEVTATMPVRREAQAPAKWKKADFQKAAEDFNTSIRSGSYDPFAGLWASWTTAEIRAALDECLVHPDCLTSGPGLTVANSLLKELMKRDLDAAVAWLDSAPSEAAKRRYMYVISSGWPQDQAAAGLEFLRNHRSLYPGGSAWAIVAKNIQASAAQGPAAVETMLAMLKDEGFSLDFENTLNFPPGFDFKGVVDGKVWQAMAPGGVKKGIMRAFCAGDPEQAFSWLLEKQGATGIGLMGWYGYDDPGIERLAWLGKKIDALDATQKAEYFESTLGDWVRMPDASVASFAKEARSPETRELLRKTLVQRVYAGNARSSLAALESLGDPAECIRALEEAAPAGPFATGHPPMSPANEAFIKTKLAEWNASQDQIQAIVDHLKK